MYTLNDNGQPKKHQRYMDLNDEPLIMMAPIKGYDKMPLVSIEKAVEPLIPSIPEIEQMAYVAKERCRKSSLNNLSVDQSAAIMLYTLEWEPKEESIYYLLNKSLRNEDRQALKPWFLYLKLLFTALSLLPSNSCTVYRGVKHDLKHKYKKGEKIVWWGFSSCTRTMDVLSNEDFMGASGNRTLFAIECQSGKDIHEYSYFKKESEVLLPAAREFQIQSVVPQAGGLSIIQLKEVEPKYPLLESNLTISKIVSKVSLPESNQVAPKTLPQPIHTQPIQMTQNQPYCIETDHSTQKDSPSPVYHSDSSSSHGCRYYCFIACGIIFCCPCTFCYLCCCNS